MISISLDLSPGCQCIHNGQTLVTLKQLIMTNEVKNAPNEPPHFSTIQESMLPPLGMIQFNVVLGISHITCENDPHFIHVPCKPESLRDLHLCHSLSVVCH